MATEKSDSSNKASLPDIMPPTAHEMIVSFGYAALISEHAHDHCYETAIALFLGVENSSVDSGPKNMHFQI